MKLLILSSENRQVMADMSLSIMAIATNAAKLKQAIEKNRIGGEQYSGILDTETDLALLCIQQLQTSLSDVQRYLANLKSLTS